MEKCKYFGVCGACKYLDMPYNEQLQLKTNYVSNKLNDLGIDIDVDETIGLYYPYKYRNKLHLAVVEHKGKTTIGFFEEHSNKVINIDNCMLFDSWAEIVINNVKDYIKNFKITGYNRETKSGLIKYIVARFINNQLMITIVATSQNFPNKEFLYNKLCQNFKSVIFYLNINNRTDNLVFDDNKFVHKFGAKKLEGNINGVMYELSPNSFFQINEKIANKIYLKANDFLSPTNKNTVIDLYSGIGITSVIFSKRAKQVISIEYVKNAVADSKKIALKNNSNNIIQKCGTCGEILGTLVNIENPLVFLDPARMGCELQTIDNIIKLQPSKICYMSCNVESLVRDLQLIIKSNLYKIDFVTPYDMFPHTNHVEVLCGLTKIK